MITMIVIRFDFDEIINTMILKIDFCGCRGCSVILYIAARELNTQAYNVEDVLVEAAQNASTKLHSVSSSLSSAEGIVVQYSVPLASAINSTAVKLNSTAAVVSDKVFVNKKTYQQVFKIM